MPTRIAINGFGRIGRCAFKIALEKKNVEVVAINDLMDNATLAHLVQYDTAMGKFSKKVSPTKKGLKVDGKEYAIFSEKDPANLPWKDLKVDVVLECTGIFKDKEKASGHIKAGAKKVIISAPSKDEKVQNLVSGTKDTFTVIKKGKTGDVISMASCTTNCISPIMQVLEDNFGVDKALMTTIHAYTSTQNLVDGPNKDLRRARAAAQNMIPTSTGAAIATTKVIPKLNDKFDGISVRVPVITGSLADITAVLKKNATVEQVNNAFKKAAKDPAFKGILAVSEESLVSSDFIGDSHSSTVDLEFTRVVGGNMVKILSWYDNEWGYSTRLVEMAAAIGRLK